MGVEREKATAAVCGPKLSAVVPGDVAGDAVVPELTDMDLVMKQLHCLTAAHNFRQNEVVDELRVTDLKEAHMLFLLASGRPFAECNGYRLRIMETSCSRALEDMGGRGSLLGLHPCNFIRGALHHDDDSCHNDLRHWSARTHNWITILRSDPFIM